MSMLVVLVFQFLPDDKVRETACSSGEDADLVDCFST